MTNNFVRYWKKQQAKKRRQHRALTQEARSELGQIEQVLRDRYGAQKIILFGSLAKDRFTEESDIDLAVAGLAPTEFFDAYAEVNRLSRFRVDLKPLDRLDSHFYHRILTQGEILHETPERV